MANGGGRWELNETDAIWSGPGHEASWRSARSSSPAGSHAADEYITRNETSTSCIRNVEPVTDPVPLARQRKIPVSASATGALAMSGLAAPVTEGEGLGCTRVMGARSRRPPDDPQRMQQESSARAGQGRATVAARWGGARESRGGIPDGARRPRGDRGAEARVPPT
jgi:hypothetical protein